MLRSGLRALRDRLFRRPKPWLGPILSPAKQRALPETVNTSQTLQQSFDVTQNSMVVNKISPSVSWQVYGDHDFYLHF